MNVQILGLVFFCICFEQLYHVYSSVFFSVSDAKGEKWFKEFEALIIQVN